MYKKQIARIKELCIEHNTLWHKLEKRSKEVTDETHDFRARWNDSQVKELSKKYHGAMKEATDLLRGILVDWARLHGSDCNARVELQFWGDYGGRKPYLSLGMVSLWNSKGALKGSTWMNKISVDASTGKIISHKIRSDKSMLEPMDSDFAAFAQQLYKELGCKR